MESGAYNGPHDGPYDGLQDTPVIDAVPAKTRSYPAPSPPPVAMMAGVDSKQHKSSQTPLAGYPSMFGVPDSHNRQLPQGWTKTQQLPAKVTTRSAAKSDHIESVGDESSTSVGSSAVSTGTGTYSMVPSVGVTTIGDLDAESTDESAGFQEEPLRIVEEGREQATRTAAASTATKTSAGDLKPDEEIDAPSLLEVRTPQHQQQQQPTTPQQRVLEAPEQQQQQQQQEQALELKPQPQQQQERTQTQAQTQILPANGGLEDEQQRVADDLVQATLIRDVDDSSEHSDPDELMPPLPQTILTRDTTTGAITVESDMAVVEAKPVEPVQAKTMSRKLICAVMGLLLLVIAALSVGFVVSAQRQGDSDSDNGGQDEGSDGNNSTVTPTVFASPVESLSPTATPIPVLQRLRKEGGVLRCGVLPGPGLFYHDDNGEPKGFDAALCAAVAAAATGDPKNVEYRHDLYEDTFLSLKKGEVDIVAAGLTHTMERQVHESSSKSGFAFTVPYLYQGMQLAGDPTLVDCGDQGLEYIAACAAIRVCVVDRSTHQQMLSSYLPGQKLIPISTRDDLRKSLADGTCNVIAHEGYNLATSLVRSAGYEGPYKVGRTLFSKEPLAMLTAPDDPQFSDFANSIVQALVVAEANNITQSTAGNFEQTDVFGEEYKDMFRHAVAAGGNYGELYEQFLEPYSKRQGLNMINYGNSTTTGLLYSHPFGSITSEDGEASGTLLDVRRRDVLRCGVRPNRTGFAELGVDQATGAVISPSGIEIDYCRALAGSIFEARGDKVEFVDVVDEQDGFAKLASGDLDVLAGAIWNFPNDASVPGVDEGFSFTQPYFYGSKDSLVEEENLSLATRQDDHLWSSFVYWISAAIIQAEETNIDQGMSNSMPPIYLFGEEFSLCFQDAILTVGNQKEIYDRNLENLVPRSGRNLPNGNVGPQMYPIQGMMDLEM